MCQEVSIHQKQGSPGNQEALRRASQPEPGPGPASSLGAQFQSLDEVRDIKFSQRLGIQTADDSVQPVLRCLADRRNLLPGLAGAQRSCEISLCFGSLGL